MDLSRYPILAQLELACSYPSIAAVLADLPAKDRSEHKELFKQNFRPVANRKPERIAWDFRYMLEHHLDEYPTLQLTDQDIITRMKLGQREARFIGDIWKWLIKWKIVKRTANPTIYEIIPE